MEGFSKEQSTIINYSKPLTSASHDRWSLHRVRREFIQKKSPQQQPIVLTANHDPSAYNAVKYVM